MYYTIYCCNWGPSVGFQKLEGLIVQIHIKGSPYFTLPLIRALAAIAHKRIALRGNKKKLFPTSMYFKKSTPFSLLFYEYKLRVFSWKKILLSQGEKYKLKLQNLAFRNNFYFVLKADLLKLSLYFFLLLNLSLCFFNFDSKCK